MSKHPCNDVQNWRINVGRIGGFLVPLFPHKIIFCSHVPQQNVEMFPGKIMPYKNRETSFFHFQFITSGKKAGSRLGHRADVINTKRRRILLYQSTNFAKSTFDLAFLCKNVVDLEDLGGADLGRVDRFE